jgi:hypothetical protein
MEMLLLAHKGSIDLTLSTQHKGYGLNPQISQREVGECLTLRSSAESLRTAAIHYRRLGVLIPLKGEN